MESSIEETQRLRKALSERVESRATRDANEALDQATSIFYKKDKSTKSLLGIKISTGADE